MLNDRITFWWNEKSKLFIPIGGKIRDSLGGGYWVMERVKLQGGYLMTFNMEPILLISG